MRRAVLDPNILISALLSPGGTPARLLASWLAGDFELVVSNRLFAELERALAYRKLRSRISSQDARALVELLGGGAEVTLDPPEPPPVRSSDPGDDYLLALAAGSDAALVSGDRHLLDLSGQLPIFSAQAFLELLGER